ncbi:RNA-guided endonuclease InsQ/TnpB family protein [Nocardiopsis valliformis]|uniref:RNA-guided endonuclease InsQ/TnpB family protein n=1 Tax=Nocardiopsis valliformis TaxID=239974 RepID=UPI0004770D07|nr:RNA-guided endonuclease TnpB family protein [Nocardiopsis valliformis]
MSRFRLYPTSAQQQQMLQHCAHARYVWNLALEVTNTYRKGGARTARPPRFAALCRMLTQARRTDTSDLDAESAAEFAWVASGNTDVQQQALKDFDQAISNFLGGSHGYPKWRKKHRNEGFRVIGTGRVPAYTATGEPLLNAKGKQVMHRKALVQKLNRKWGQVKVPGCGWVKFRLTRRELPDAKSLRITYRDGLWHVAFATLPDPVPEPGDGSVVGVDRGVAITAALSDGRMLNCPQPSTKEKARRRKHERRAARAPKNSPAKAAEYAKVARLKAKEVARRKDWVEKTSTMLARSFDTVRFEDLKVKNMTASAKGTAEQPGSRVRQKSGLNRAILAQGWGMLRQRTGHKAPGRVQDVPARNTSLRCSDCQWIDKNSRQNQARFVCTRCGFSCNTDLNASNNVAAGQDASPAPLGVCAGGVIPRPRSSAREPQ